MLVIPEVTQRRLDELLADLERSRQLATDELDAVLTSDMSAGNFSARHWVRELALLNSSIAIALETRLRLLSTSPGKPSDICDS